MDQKKDAVKVDTAKKESTTEFVKLNEIDNVEKLKKYLTPIEVSLIKQPVKVNKEFTGQYSYRLLTYAFNGEFPVTIKDIDEVEAQILMVERNIKTIKAVAKITGWYRACRSKRTDGSEYRYLQFWLSKNVFKKYFLNFKDTLLLNVKLEKQQIKAIDWIDVPFDEVKDEDLVGSLSTEPVE